MCAPSWTRALNMSLQHPRGNSGAAKMTTSDHAGPGMGGSTPTAGVSGAAPGWYARLSGLWCSVVSTLRSAHTHRQASPDSKTSSTSTSSRTDRSTSTLSSCTETSDTWKYRSDHDRTRTSEPDGHTYYNLIEDFPLGTPGGLGLPGGGRNGGRSVGIIVGEMFPEEEIFNCEGQQESIIPIQVHAAKASVPLQVLRSAPSSTSPAKCTWTHSQV